MTLTGPGGVGKTRLAIEAARAHPTAAKWFVDLVPAKPDDVVAAIATTLGVTDRPNVSLEQAVQEALSAQPALLVLDNCEHVLDATAAVTGRLLQACPDTVVLATSREVLGVPGERIVPVRPLEVDGDDDGAVKGSSRALRLAARRRATDDFTRLPRFVPGSMGCCWPSSLPLLVARTSAFAVLRCARRPIAALARTRGADERHRPPCAVLD